MCNSGDVVLNAKDGVLVSETEIYLQEGQTQLLPCPGLEINNNTIVFSWFRITTTPDGTSKDLILRSAGEQYGGDFSANARYQLTRDFSLAVKSIEARDAGRYQCLKVSSIEAENMDSFLDVVVMGESLLYSRTHGLLSPLLSHW